MAFKIDRRDLPAQANPSTTEPAAPGKTKTSPPGKAQPGKTQPGGSGAASKKDATGDYAKLAAKLSASDRSPQTLNRLGVCHLRLGNADEAVRIYRGLVLQPGCTWERTDIPQVYRVNYATALLLSGQPAGCIEVLQSKTLADHPRALELRAAIKRWERSLGFFKRWDWRLNGVTPKDCHIELDFEPGEFEEAATA